MHSKALRFTSQTSVMLRMTCGFQLHCSVWCGSTRQTRGAPGGLAALAELAIGEAHDLHPVAAARIERDRAAGTPDEIGGMGADDEHGLGRCFGVRHRSLLNRSRRWSSFDGRLVNCRAARAPHR